MIKRILNSRLPLMVFNPVKVFELKYFNDIYLAGGLPVYDTEFLTPDEIVKNAGILAREDFLFAIRLARCDHGLIRELKSLGLTNLDAIIVPLDDDAAPGQESGITDTFSGFNDTRIILEIRDVNVTEKIDAVDPHALILKGNEAPGKVSKYSSFILMQWYLKNTAYPLFIHGGVGRYTSAGLFTAGVSGIVLDSQVLLTDEAPVSDRFKKLLSSVDEGDSTEITFNGTDIYRVFAKLGTKIVKDIKQEAVLLADDIQGKEKLYDLITKHMSATDRDDVEFIQSLFYLGQDGIFAKDFVKDQASLSGLISSLFKGIGDQLAAVDRFDPVVPESEFAKDQGTRLPLIQGPMANISDKSAFAAKVLEEGALPFFAVGSLPVDLADEMLSNGARQVDTFGAGLVGIEAFNPFVKQHIDMVKKYKVPYALFAGGVPSQISDLEQAGCKTYLHTPSVSMMLNAMKSNCRRFIFEGGEAGGHVGALSSLVLWEAAIAKLMETDTDLADLYLVFAGGISTCYASYFMSGIGAMLASKGAKIGLQVGTAYLFSNEIVETKGMMPQYQDIIIEENETMVVGKTVGLASRTAPTEFARMMAQTEQEMIREKLSLEARKRAFEKRNIGSLLIGAKGFIPDFKNPGPENYIRFGDEDQKRKGNFLVGDSLAFFDSALTIKEIHAKYFDFKQGLYRQLNQLEIFSSATHQINDEIAVIGMGCTLPDANDPDTLWENILDKKYSIKKMPQDRLDRELYYNTDRSAEDSTYTDLAGFVEDYRFDAERFGYNDGKDKKLSRSQQMVLETAYKAVESAGYLGEDNRLACDDPKRTAVIIATCLGNELGNELQLKYYYPELLSMLADTSTWQTLSDEEKETVKQVLQTGIEGDNQGYDPVHGILLNIEASRVARHLGIRGTNYIVDAACASSFTALEAAAGELLSGEYDQVIVGGVNTHLAPESFIGFAKMGTLSARGSYPFDERADGFILGEGSVMFMLKRMKDAIRDNDPIIGVINSIGSSSDGKGKAIAAPNPAGQKLSVQRCFEKVRKSILPKDVEYIEAHGTSTIIGDQAELSTLTQTYDGAHAGISSIKSQIGHLLGCAGSAGLIKALLAVSRGVLPPNGQFETLSKNHNLDQSSLYIIEEAKPWEPGEGRSRKAGISSYGFGGINYHMLIEQMTDHYETVPRLIFTDTEYDFNDDRIVFAGLGVFLPGAGNCDEFWEKLQTGEKQLSVIPSEHFDNDAYASQAKDSNYYLPKVKAGVVTDYKFENLKYRMPPKMVKSIERGQLFGLEAANEAIENSGLAQLLQPGNRAGAILGTISGERQSKNIVRVRKQLVANMIRSCGALAENKRGVLADELVDQIRARIPENNEDTTPGLLSNLISGRITNFFGLNGANYVIDASCASATIAIRNAARSIAFKDMDYALAGGVDTNLYPAVLMAFKRLGLLSEGDCNFFDSRADGYVMGEGAAIHVMTTYKKAKEAGMTILAELNGCSIESSVPDHLLAPSEQTFVSTINKCYASAAVRKQDIDHLDLFAFSNIFGDIIEKQVAEACFDSDMFCGNIKSQFGYFKAANPAVALAKLVLMNAKGQILKDHNYSPDHSILNESHILKSASSHEPRPKTQALRFAANVNGIGGNHGHLVLSTLPLSLKHEEIKEAKSESMEKIEQTPALREYAYSADQEGRKQRMVALLSGQGAQHSGMMKGLYDADPHIRSIMDQGETIFREQRGYSLLEMMFGSDDRLNSTENTQPAVFLSSAAICSRLSQEGFTPDYYIGHSVGEYTALFCSGMLGFDDAMRLIIKRSDLMKESTIKQPGKIMVVFKNEKETEGLIRKSFISDIYVTNKNSEKQTAVSGKAEAIEKFCEFLTGQDVFHKKLNLTGAFHTPLLKEASEKLRAYLDTIRFNDTRFGKIISNTEARPYPEQRIEVKDLLARQIISPVEFIKSVEHVYESGRTHFIEIGPSRLLVNLLKNINIGEYGTAVSVDPKKGEAASFRACREYLKSLNALFAQMPVPKPAPAVPATPVQETKAVQVPAEPPKVTANMDMGDDFDEFKTKNKDLIDKILYEEYQRRKREKAIEAVERYDFNTQRILISGVSVGLPGKGRRVFADDNFEAILNGRNFIEPLTIEDQQRITDKNITKLYKQPDGNARFVQITRTEDVIHLAGQLGYFDLTDEYGIKEQYDISMALGIAAGIEALKDANIPLVMQYKPVKDGKGMIPDGFALPEEMQEETGVIITSLWPNGETLITELEKYFYEKLFMKPYEEFENIYYYLMEKVKDIEIKDQITEWFFKVKSGKRSDMGTYKFDRNFLSNACPLGSAHLAQIIKAKGPNTLVSSACASTTLAIGIAEDWIRVGRCKRVLVVGGENATSPSQNQWVGSGFLALGAATIKKRVSEAAKPFDEDRNGTILGSGAVGLVVENEASVKARGMNGQCEIMGTHIANSAYHAYNIDVPHMAREMKKFIDKVERQNNITKDEYADKLLFMSHETYTPARGGSADAEVTALETAFSSYLNRICISNTKGFTGHTLGAAIEDVVLVKALQYRKAPPIANLNKIPAHFNRLNFSGQDKIDSEYGLHLSAGFGSHFAFMFVKRIQENTTENNPIYQAWLQRITNAASPELKLIDNTLCAVADPSNVQPKPVMEPAVPAMAPPVAVAEAVPVPSPAAVINTPEPGIQIPPVESPTVVAAVPETGGSDNIVEQVKQIIAEQTGYTVDMLEAELDLEADLGIDTVKQVEIFGKVASSFGFSVPDDLKLRDLNTIAKLADYISSRVDVPVSPADQETVEAPAPVPVAAEAVQSAPVAAAGGAEVKVKEIIAEQTGYTVDMLESELDLEADLGIDTVKQVEIFGKVASSFGFSVPDDLKLRDLNTIAKLADYIQHQKGETADTPAPASIEPKVVDPVQADTPQAGVLGNNTEGVLPDPASPIKRLIVRTQETPFPEMTDQDLEGKTIAVTLDSHGFAAKVIEKIESCNGRVITLGEADADFGINLKDVSQTETGIEAFKTAHPDIDGLVHLAHLDDYFTPKEDPEGIDQAVNRSIKALFVIVKALYPMLDKPGSFIGTITFDSVIFPYMSECGDIHPLFGGVSGLLKTVNKELGKTRVKVVDFSYKQPKKSIGRIADLFMTEWLGNDMRCEAGYKNKKRYTLTMSPSVADPSGQVVKPGDTILVTGGAGGITFEILKQVVHTYKTDLVILDINDIYSTDAKYLDKQAGQAELMGMLKQDMPEVKPVEIKRALDRIMRIRQSVDNIEYLKAQGVGVTYHCVDVTDYTAVKQAVDRHDRIDGIFHAAGMEMSQFIPKKERWAFELVVDVKIKGLQNLLRAAADRDYGFLFTFSSVTARFGNEGQVDYTAANDFLGKALFREKQRHPERLCKVYAWTAWDGVGMATNPTVRKVLEDRGLQFLPMDQGVKFFMADLRDEMEQEMVFSGIDYSFDIDGLLGEPLEKSFPFLGEVVCASDQEATYKRTLDIDHDRFLLDHAMEDTPVFLGATGIETMAQAAMALDGDKGYLNEVRDFSIPYGIKLLKKRPKEIIIRSEKTGDRSSCDITSVFRNPKGVVMGDPKLHYQGTYDFSKQALPPQKREIPGFTPLENARELVKLIYHPQRLFMDGVFRTIQEILSFDGTTLVTRINDQSMDAFFKGQTDPNFITSVALLDGMFQTGGVYEFLTDSIVVLPYRIKSLKLFSKGEKHRDYLCITTRTASDNETDTFQMDLVTPDGQILVKLVDFEMVKLNKLSPEHQISHGALLPNGAVV